jgi:uncharacterized membrane protein
MTLFTFIHNYFHALNKVSFQNKETVVDLVQQIFEDIFSIQFCAGNKIPALSLAIFFSCDLSEQNNQGLTVG